MKLLFSFLTACLFAIGAHAQQPSLEEMFDRYAQAIGSGDLQALIAMHSDDVVFVPSSGLPMVKGKAAVESYYKALFSNTSSRQLVKTGYEWQVYGDTAIRTSNGLFEAETANGKTNSLLRNTYVFHKEGQDWKLVNLHVSKRTTEAATTSK